MDFKLNNWFFDFEKAKAESKKTRKPILLQFHRDSCSGCRTLYNLTYQDTEVASELFNWFVPLHIDIRKDHRIRSQYAAVWTPSFYFLDYRGKLYFAFPGYLPPEDFRMIIRLGLAAVLIPRGKYQESIDVLNDGIEKFPDNPRASNALFLREMAKYLKTWDNKGFRRGMSEIREKYPHSPEARMWPWVDL